MYPYFVVKNHWCEYIGSRRMFHILNEIVLRSNNEERLLYSVKNVLTHTFHLFQIDNHKFYLVIA